MADHEHGPAIMEQLEAVCRSQGGRWTRQRRAVMERLMTASKPMSAYELVDVLRKEDPAATAASVYRSLDFLIQCGVVHRLETTKSFVACGHPDHPHSVQFLICRRCGTAVEAEDKKVDIATKNLGQRLGFSLDQRVVELVGICAECRRAPGTEII